MIYIYMCVDIGGWDIPWTSMDVSNRQIYGNTNFVFASPWPFRGCKKPS